jgi:hypothetical protein
MLIDQVVCRANLIQTHELRQLGLLSLLVEYRRLAGSP